MINPMDLFGKVAVASTFSPRFLPLLAEARAVSALLGCPIEIIHAGEEDAESRERFDHAFAEMGFSAPIHWRQASQPSAAIIQAINDTGTGLLLAGAMERDSQGRYFLGQVARVLVRDAPCSLLLYAHPEREPTPFRTLAVVVDYTPASRHALQAALDLARCAGAGALHVLRVFTLFQQALAQPQEFIKGTGSSAVATEEARLDAFVEEFEIDDVPIITRCIEGATGFAASDFVQSIGADLLIIASEPASGHSAFPARMEWLENTIPANLLVIRPPATPPT